MKKISIAVPVIWTAIVFFLHVMKVEIENDSSFKFPHADKLVHFGMFCSLGFLMLRSFLYNASKKLSRVHIILLFLLCTAYGAGLEYLQGTSLINRDRDILDWIADCFGSASGILIAQTKFLPFLFGHEVRKTA